MAIFSTIIWTTPSVCAQKIASVPVHTKMSPSHCHLQWDPYDAMGVTKLSTVATKELRRPRRPSESSKLSIPGRAAAHPSYNDLDIKPTDG